ncbi:MAG: ubiquinol-cytochrome c reductase iron-sulfur subunit [Acidobacteriota bacterium]|jgi:Rieske Fe-S protein
MEGTTQSTRRRFVNWLLGLSTGALFGTVLYPVARFLSPPERAEAATNQVEAGPVNDPAFVDKGYKIVSFGADPVIVVRVGSEEFRAFAATCTHLSCIVEYRKSKELIWCNCHNGAFNLKGQVVGGPPPNPLTQYTVHLVSENPALPKTVVVSRSA